MVAAVLTVLFEGETVADRDVQEERAEAFYAAHRAHVDRLMAGAESQGQAYAPSGSDVFRPDLWKAPHWRWYLAGRR